MIQVKDIRSYPKNSGVYLFRNKLNGKVYVGESVNMRARMSGHINDRSTESKKLHVHRAFDKHGIDAFDFYILEVYPNRMGKEFLVSREFFWIKFYNSICDGVGYNKVLFSTRKEYPPITFVPSEAQRKKMSERMLGNDRSKGLVHDDAARQKIRDNMKNGHKNKLRPVLQLDILSGEVIKEWESCAHAARELVGNPTAHSAIAKFARGNSKRRSAYGFLWKFKDGKTGGLTKHKPKTPIRQVNKDTGETIKQWDSIIEAVKFLQSQGVRASTTDISRSAKTENKTAFGYKWRL